VEVSGEVIEGLNVIGGYAFLDNEITEAEDDTLGNELPNVAKHSASLWMTYDVIASVAERLTLGGGIFFKGDRFTSSANNSVLPSYVTADVMAQYEFGVGEQRLRARAGIKNLFDEEVFVSGFGRGLALRGEPRTFTAELGITF